MLSQLNIHGLRNIDSMQLSLHPRFNFFCGPNGSGKTSILESIYLLGSGYSFRTREIAPLVKQGQTSLTVFSKTMAQDAISIQKNLSGATMVRLNQQPCQRSSELARFLPCQLFYHDLFQIIDAGPSVRRSILDWGLFHVEPSYHGIWKDYRLALKQRNALLRQQAKAAHFAPWDTQLAALAEALDRLRAPYFKDWSEQFQAFLMQLTDTPCYIRYDKGWDKKETGKSLKTILEEQLEQDRQRQYTYSGAHHADVVFDSVALKAKQHLSRGQQKIILIALKLAQAQLIDKPCMYLMDDITVELDQVHIQRLFDRLLQLPGQFFLTSVHPVPEVWRQEGQVIALDNINSL
ncbi:MAG: DNA replication/repair protein RecF [Gammaproteobacteria bacterium]|nr:DNA replication/repair protein RecF [Gammaproteobacteria bacterium]